MIKVSLDRPLKLMERSNSSYVSHLEPIRLHFRLPEDYPSDCPPEVRLVCDWLDEVQAERLTRALAERHRKGEVVLFDWCQLLREEALALAGIDGEVRVDGPDRFGRMLHHHDLEEADEKELLDCPVCFVSLAYSDSLRLEQCGHRFCRECLFTHCNTKIQGGNAANLDCPEMGCQEEVPGHLVRQLVDEDLFNTYDRVKLDFAIRLDSVANCLS